MSNVNLNRDKLIEILDNWKKNADPDSRKRDYRIEINEMAEKILIIFDKKIVREFDITINNVEFVIFEDFELNKNACYMNDKKFKKMLIDAQPELDEKL